MVTSDDSIFEVSNLSSVVMHAYKYATVKNAEAINKYDD